MPMDLPAPRATSALRTANKLMQVWLSIHSLCLRRAVRAFPPETRRSLLVLMRAEIECELRQLDAETSASSHKA